MRFVVTAFLALMLAPLPAAAEVSAPAADPAINAPYLDPDFHRWQGTFERPGREVYDRREAIVEALRLAPGMAVADVGAGTGLFTRLIARAVGPAGKVYAVDIAPNFVAGIEAGARAEGLENVVGVVNDQHATGLPPDSVDRVFISDTYHHFEQPEAMLASIRRALRPRGELVIVDFRRDPAVSSAWVLGHVRVGEPAVISEVEAAGFELIESLDLLRTNYFLRFRRSSSP